MGSELAVERGSFERSEVRTVGLSLELSLSHFGRNPVSGRGVRFWSMVDKLRTQRAYSIAASPTAQCQAYRHLTSGSWSYSSSASRATIMPRQLDKQRAKSRDADPLSSHRGGFTHSHVDRIKSKSTFFQRISEQLDDSRQWGPPKASEGS